MALTQPRGGSDPQAIRTTARADDANYVINGAKTWISNTRRSQLLALLCRTRHRHSSDRPPVRRRPQPRADRGAAPACPSRLCPHSRKNR
ncbi:acyl-CoA dehydrogenase family protein [Streptomyces microflavus]|uniref:acyl-CoA dehydrogenase family protein n=1 Tax=Streptomyces microflavus TaxID=1919 RepID=UPI0034210DCF